MPSDFCGVRAWNGTPICDSSDYSLRCGQYSVMIARRIAIAVSAATIGLGLLTAPAARATPGSGNDWYPVDYDVNAEDGPAWRATMAANGRGVVFSGENYRDYDATSDTWGSWTRLHTDPERLIAQGNARGDVCTAWSADFGAAIACRKSGARTFAKKNISTSRNATVGGLAVSRDGRRALIIWRDTTNNGSREYATVYTLATGRILTTRLRGIPGGTPLGYDPAAARVGRANGFVLAYRTGAEDPWGSATYYRTFAPRSGWSAQTALRLGTPARDVVISDISSDGRRTYVSVTPDIPQASADAPSVWWISELRNGTFTPPGVVNETLYWPVIGSSGANVHIAGSDPANRELVIAGFDDFSSGTLSTFRFYSPQVADTVGRVSDVSIVGQRFSDGNDGFSAVVQYTGISNPGDESEEDVDQLFSVRGSLANITGLERLGAKSGYEGMGTTLAGYGKYALAVYSSGMQLYAAAKTGEILMEPSP